MKITASLIYILALILTACQGKSAIMSPPPTYTSVLPTQADDLTTPSLTMPDEADVQALIQKAKEDLAQRLGVSLDSIEVAAVINQEFSKDAFNCRTSKERTTKEEPPLVISGHTVLLSASGHRYEYHLNDQSVVFCRALD